MPFEYGDGSSLTVTGPRLQIEPVGEGRFVEAFQGG